MPTWVQAVVTVRKTEDRSLELLGITEYIPAIQFSNTPEKYGFTHAPQEGAFVCSKGDLLTYYRLKCNKSIGKYLRSYQANLMKSACGKGFWQAFFRGHARMEATCQQILILPHR